MGNFYKLWIGYLCMIVLTGTQKTSAGRRSIKATPASKHKRDLWVGAFAPYGYIKDPNNKNHLIVDEEAAEIVRHVFDLYLKGFSCSLTLRRISSAI